MKVTGPTRVSPLVTLPSRTLLILNPLILYLGPTSPGSFFSLVSLTYTLLSPEDVIFSFT